MMSEPRPFPMPEVIPPVSPYAPRSQETSDFELDPVNHIRRIDEIRGIMRCLLHREMRELVKEIFEAHAKIPRTETTTSRSPAITAGELADVLDKFAFGD
jgi:hypothetical protein